MCVQAAVIALQAAVDRFSPPPGYKPPPAGDAAYVQGLLAYAHRLSYSTSAPLGYQPGQQLYFFKPPAPQEAEMRASQLHAFNRELVVELGEALRLWLSLTSKMPRLCCSHYC